MPAHFEASRLDRLAEECRGPFCGRQQARQHLHRRGLTAAVGAEKAEDLTLLDCQADAIDRGKVAEAACQALGIDRNFRFVGHSRRNDELFVTATLALRQQRDEAVIQVLSTCSLHQLGGRSCRKYLSGIHRDDPVPLLRLIHVGRGNDHAHAWTVCANVVNELPKLSPRERIDSGRRLVENKQGRFVDQCTAEPHLLLHSAGKFAGRTACKRSKSGGVEQFRNASFSFLGGTAQRVSP